MHKKYFFLLFVFYITGCATVPSRLPSQNFSSEVKQIILVEPKQFFEARVTAWENKDGAWRRIFWPMRATVGRRGIAPNGEKREGDGRSPSGTYALGTAFGYVASFPTKLAYRQSTEQDFWVDDVDSLQYNQWVTGAPQAKSFELMRRHDDLYKYGVVIEYNTHPIVPGRGSAIFMHIWRGPGRLTSGCVAMSPRSLRHLIAWLDATKHPIIILNQP